MRKLILVALCAACSGSSTAPSDGGGGGKDSGSTTRFLRNWDNCTFGRRLEFTTPSGTPDRAMVDVPGSLLVTDNGDGTLKTTPTATGITNCVVNFTLASTLSYATIVPGQTCDDNGLTLSWSPLSDMDVSTQDLAASFTLTFTGTYMGQAASGNGGTVYHCLH